jgi:hypothetical protein
MRKNIKKGLKNNYGKKEGKEALKSFDEVKTNLEDSLLAIEEDNQEAALHFNENQLNMVSSFLDWYIPEIKLTYEKAGKKLHEEDRAQIELLEAAKEKFDQMKVAYV